MPKPTPKQAMRALVCAVLPMNEIQALSLKEACVRFAERAAVSQRAFAEMGKLHHAINGNLKKGQTIYGELRKLAVKDSTISNASYASRVWGELVAAGHLTEADYDGFTFHDCLAICKAVGGKSARQLGAEEVAVIVRSKPETFDAELTSIYETGLTVEEAEAQAAAEVARRAEEEATAKQAAAAKIEAEKQAAIAAALENERMAKEAQASAAAPSVGSTGVPPVVPAVPASTPSDTASAPTAEPTPTDQSNPTDPTEPDAEEPAAPAAAPTNIHPMPGAATTAPTAAADLPAVLSAIDEIGVLASEFSPEEKLAVLTKLQEVIDFLGENFAPVAKVA